MKPDRLERILIITTIINLILLVGVQMYHHNANKRLQVQIDTLREETILRQSDTLKEVRRITHPAVMNQRQIDWMMGVYKE